MAVTRRQEASERLPVAGIALLMAVPGIVCMRERCHFTDASCLQQDAIEAKRCAWPNSDCYSHKQLPARSLRHGQRAGWQLRSRGSATKQLPLAHCSTRGLAPGDPKRWAAAAAILSIGSEEGPGCRKSGGGSHKKRSHKKLAHTAAACGQRCWRCGGSGSMRNACSCAFAGRTCPAPRSKTSGPSCRCVNSPSCSVVGQPPAGAGVGAGAGCGVSSVHSAAQVDAAQRAASARALRWPSL